MDASKLEKLKQVGYAVNKSCYFCRYADIKSGRLFGTCNFHTYNHEKHTGEPRQLSIVAMGTCKDYEADGLVTGLLEGFLEFVK